MNKPQLIAETPRAGKWNSRFLAAPDGSLSDSEVAKIVTAARRNPKGDDYLAVSADRAQLLSGRTGKEILVLVGVDVKKLSETERQQIFKQLEQRLNEDLATLVTEGIDWDRDGQALLVKRRELGDWEKGFDGLPTVLRREKKAAEPEKPSSGRLKVVVGVVGILLVLGLAIWPAITQKPEKDVPPRTPPQTTQIHTPTGEVSPPTSDAEPDETELQKAQKECVETFKTGIEQFLNKKGEHDTTCNPANTPTSETNIKNFLKEWCNLTLEPDYKKKKVDKYRLHTPKVKNLIISKEEFKQLEQYFQNFNKCKNPS